MKTLKPGPRTEILADIAKAAKELKEDDFAELIKSIQTSKKNLENLSEKIDWELTFFLTGFRFFIVI